MAKNIDDHIFMFIGDKAFTLKDLGPAADMRIDKAMQSILDQGLLGEQYVGVPWFQVIKSSGLKLEGAPAPEEVLQHTLYLKYQEALEACQDKSRAGTLTEEDKAAMMRLRRDWEAATKLAKP